LLERAKARDEQAWRRLVELYGPLVYRWCRRPGLDQEKAAEVGQEVFLEVWRRLGEFRHDRPGDTFRGWLKAITRSKVADYFRRSPAEGRAVGGSDAQARLDALASEDVDGPDEAEDEGLVLRSAVEALLARHNEKTRQAFLRVVLDRQDPADVARDLGMTRNAVYLAKSHVLRQLREEYAGLLDLDRARW
jgi:RNA polymerase sigma-70 factor (ECF subfamily)